MGMNALTIVQLVGIILGYSALVLGLPALALRRPLLRLGQPGHLGKADRLESLGAADWLLFLLQQETAILFFLHFFCSSAGSATVLPSLSAFCCLLPSFFGGSRPFP